MKKTTATVLIGDAITRLHDIESNSIQCIVTSPPYFGLRDYGVDGQLGLESTPDEYVCNLVSVFREARRVLKADGTLWLNLGDSYAANRSYQVPSTKGGTKHGPAQAAQGRGSVVPDGLKPKDLIGIPWRVAFALQADGWYLRQDIIWHKPNPMPESVTDRCTKAHEYLFLLSKSDRYYFDSDAIREPYADGSYSADAIAKNGGVAGGGRPVGDNFNKKNRHESGTTTPKSRAERARLLNPLGRNKRSVWTIPTKPYRGAHFATFPPALIEPCTLASSAEGDTVLDPFSGSGTTCLVALKHRRKFIGIDINKSYVTDVATVRITTDAYIDNVYQIHKWRKSKRYAKAVFAHVKYRMKKHIR